MIIVDGKKIASEILHDCKERISTLKNKGLTTYIEIILVGEDESSEKYVNMKLEKIKEMGADGTIRKIDESKSEDDIIKVINELNLNEKIHGILIQLPLPDKFNEERILSEISLEKDIDALSPITLDKIEQQKQSYCPAGVGAVLKVFEHHKVEINGKNITIIGITNLLGRPLSSVLKQSGGIVKEINVGDHLTFEDLKNSDIIVTDVGKPGWLKGEMVKEQVVVIDAANNYVGEKLVGDADVDELLDKASIITPVPGGIGPILIASLIDNLVRAAERL